MEPFTCHCFRHTFATRCFEAGIQPKTVQEYLGHATLQMTMDLYTKVMKDFKAMEIDKLESMLDEVESFNDNYVEEKYNVIVGNEEDSIKKLETTWWHSK